MSTELEESGPIDYLVVEFPGSKMTGEGFPLLVDLVDSGIIRILDLVFVTRELDGSVKALEISDFDRDGELDLAVFEGACSGLLGSRRHRRGDLGHRTGQFRRHPGLRERLGGALRRGPAPGRGAAGGQRPDPGPGDPRRPRQGRSRGRTGRGLRQRPPPTPHHRKAQPMPGLIRGVARTAVVAGTARAVSGRVQRRQQGRWAQQEQEAAAQQPQPAYAQPAPGYAEPALRRRRHPAAAWTTSSPNSSNSVELRDAGVLSDAEFEAQKGKICTHSPKRRCRGRSKHGGPVVLHAHHGPAVGLGSARVPARLLRCRRTRARHHRGRPGAATSAGRRGG